jgi:hypothetical protein
MDERPVNIFGKLADVPEDPARQISTKEIHGVQTDRQLSVLWQTTHMHQTSVKVRVSVFSAETAETKVGDH